MLAKDTVWPPYPPARSPMSVPVESMIQAAAVGWWELATKNFATNAAVEAFPGGDPWASRSSRAAPSQTADGERQLAGAQRERYPADWGAPGQWKDSPGLGAEALWQGWTSERRTPLKPWAAAYNGPSKAAPARPPPGLTHPSQQDRIVAGGAVQMSTPCQQRTTILWCAESTEAWMEERGGPQRSAAVQGSRLGSISFQTVPKFTRWMFKQERGADLTPWAILVVGWREAKPCVCAVEAAATERVDGLRQDAQRKLRAATCGRRGSEEVRVAVSTVIIIVENTQQEDRAAKFIASREQHGRANGPEVVRVLLARTAADLRTLVSALADPDGDAADRADPVKVHCGLSLSTPALVSSRPTFHTVASATSRDAETQGTSSDAGSSKGDDADGLADLSGSQQRSKMLRNFPLPVK